MKKVIIVLFYICLIFGFTYWLNFILLMISSSSDFITSSMYYSIDDTECGDEYRDLANSKQCNAKTFYGIFKFKQND